MYYDVECGQWYYVLHSENELLARVLYFHSGHTFTSRKYGIVMLLVASVSVSVSCVRVLTFESLYLETSCLVCRYVFGTSRSGSNI